MNDNRNLSAQLTASLAAVPASTLATTCVPLQLEALLRGETEYPQVQVSPGVIEYRGFRITEYPSVGGRPGWFGYEPIDAAEHRVWTAYWDERDPRCESPDMKHLWWVIDAVDAWRAGVR